MPDSTITSKGQITLPKAVREHLHLSAGDTVGFDIREDGSVWVVARNEPVDKLFGLLKGKAKRRKPIRVDEMNPASAVDDE